MRTSPGPRRWYRILATVCLTAGIIVLFPAFQRGFPGVLTIIGLQEGDESSRGLFEYSVQPGSDRVHVESGGIGNPFINLEDGRLFEEKYQGTVNDLLALTSGGLQPSALTRADFDEDAMPDVVTAYSSPSGGVFTLRRGNADVISPMSREALGRFREGKTTNNPFSEEIQIWSIASDPDFLASGDFNNDGHMDLVVASNEGEELNWIFGTGDGAFSDPSATLMDGHVTTLRAGEFGREDGLAELAVGITGDSNSIVEVFQNAEGAFRAAPRRIAIPSPITDFVLDDLTGDDLSDLIVISDSSLHIVEAPKSDLEIARVSTYQLPFNPQAVETGNFTPGMNGKQTAVLPSQIALVSDTGDLYLWSDGMLSPVVAHFPKSVPDRLTLVRSRVADRSRDGLAVIDGGTNQIHLVTQDHFEAAFGSQPFVAPMRQDNESQLLPSPLLPPVDFASSGRPVAVLSTRYNQDALDDLVILTETADRRGGAGNDLSVALTAPMANFVVNSASNEVDGDTDDAICDTGNATDGLTGLCTLRAAIMQANKGVQTGITFTVPAITIPNTSGFTRITKSVIIDGRIGTSNRVMLTTDWVGGIPGTGAMFEFDKAASGNSTVLNMEIFDLPGSPAIWFDGSSHNVVQGNYFHNLGSSAIRAWSGSGSGSTSIQIGGLTTVPGTGLGNVLSGNTDGIHFGTNLDTPGLPYGSHTVQGNIIGADQTGDAAQPNGVGIVVESHMTSGTVIGGPTETARNIISGNTDEGINMIPRLNLPPGTGMRVQGNYIGTDWTGLIAISNEVGILLSDSLHVIGGNAVEARNLISGSTDEGIRITRWTNSPIPRKNLIQNNIIGLGADGDTPIPNGNHGISLASGSILNKIVDNIISSNEGYGISISGSTPFPSVGNEIDGNYIGLNEAGTDARPNGRYGIRIFNASGTLIGASKRNVISGNGDAGIVLSGALATGNIITRNFIGTDILASNPVANLLGVEIEADASNNRVGGEDQADANTIAFNTEEGIRVITGSGNSFLGNSIFMNGREGIDLDQDGINATGDASTPNDALDADTGPNGLQNWPVISSVQGGSTIVEGTLLSEPNKTYRIEFFSNETPESDGLFEGHKFLGSVNVTTDGIGGGGFTETFQGTETYITATATGPDGSTSEFTGPRGIVVNSIADAVDVNIGNSACDTGNTILRGGIPEPECTLRAAISETNLLEDEVIAFDIPMFGKTASIPIIEPESALPTIISAVTIDGTTQPGGIVAIDGIATGDTDNGLHVTGGNSTILGLSIYDFSASGILLENGGNNKVRLSNIGFNPEQAALQGNSIGIGIKNSNGNEIGGRSEIERNVISDNDSVGVHIAAGSTGNKIYGNLIGTTKDGNASLGNDYGVIIRNSSENVLGRQGIYPGNVISGNVKDGVVLIGNVGTDTNNNIVAGNIIGLAGSSASAVPNEQNGIVIEDAIGTTVGGDDPIDANTISGNRHHGILLKGELSYNNRIAGNRIGTDPTGNIDVGNERHGVALLSILRKNVIGGEMESHGNVISGNDSSGVYVSHSDSVVIFGNYIGTNAGHEVDLGNLIGVYLNDARYTAVGDTVRARRNWISKNDSTGVAVVGATSTGNAIRGNYLFANAGISIDLGANGPTANDLGDGKRASLDADVGPNEMLNYPIALTTVEDSLDASIVIISGVLDVPTPTDNEVDIYMSEKPSPKKKKNTRFGDAETYLGTVNPTASGAFSFVIPKADISLPYLSAIATGKNGSSSEVSWVCFDTDGNNDTDNDDDGLCDDWETKDGGGNGGIDYNGDGDVDLDLTSIDGAESADPDTPDLFVEVDYMQPGGGHGRGDKPQAGVLGDVVAPFTAQGVNLHLLQDDADVLPHTNVIRFKASDPGVLDDFNDYKLGNPVQPCGPTSTAHFGNPADRTDTNCASIIGARRLAFRYTIFGHTYKEYTRSSGIAELPGNDFFVTVGSWRWRSVADQRMKEAGTLMHEMGHTFNLRHGGKDDIHWKPNYPSAMNYMLQFTWTVPGRTLDYSQETLPTLDETALNEAAGVGGTIGRTMVYNQDGSGVSGRKGTDQNVSTAAFVVDWNGSGGPPDAGAKVDLNYHGVYRGGSLVAAAPGFEVKGLTGYDDWSNIRYNFRDAKDFGDGASRSEESNSDPDMDSELYDYVISTFDFDKDGFPNGVDNCPQFANPDQEDTDGDGIGDICEVGATDLGAAVMANPTPAVVGQVIVYDLAVVNNGPDTATDVVLVDTLDAAVDFDSFSGDSAGCSYGDGVVECALGDLAVSDIRTVVVSATLSQDISTINRATVYSSELDPNQSNNSAILVTPASNATDTKENTVPYANRLYESFPNPFLTSTTISFDVEKAAPVLLELYNTLGQRVRILANRMYSVGQHHVTLTSNKLSSGLYFYKISVGSFVDTKSVVVLK